MNASHALRPAWTPLTIVLMVVGFAVAWPLGLLMLAYILWGDRIPEVKRHFQGVGRDWSKNFGCGPGVRASHSGNFAFDEYRERELKRLEEERRRLDEERREFEEFVHNLRRARDREEFERFMQERRSKKGGETIDL